MPNSQANDAMIRRLEKELEERNAAAQGIIANAQDGERDLNDAESETLQGLRTRMGQLQAQITELEETANAASNVSERMKQLDQAITVARRTGESTVEYRTAGDWALDSWNASTGDRTAAERLDVFYRAAAHQKTPDNLGIVPDPIVGSVINFIDAARPMVTAIGPQPLPSGTWHRPIVTQQPSVAKQGSAGLAADEKAELVSQKMLVTRLTANAVTYGGYVNVSRQNIDFTNGQAMNLVIEGLASQYAIQTEAAVGTALDASTGTPVPYGAGASSAAQIRTALWSAAATVYSAVKGQGRLILALAPDRLAAFGPLFTPIPTAVAPGEGLVAGEFGSGTVGGISGITAVMSAGLASTKAFLFSTAAMEVFEQRVGTLQVTEPSVLGVQVAYAGYFTPLLISNNGIIELTNA
jgi:HK97 family phage major capsid protein